MIYIPCCMARYERTVLMAYNYVFVYKALQINANKFNKW